MFRKSPAPAAQFLAIPGLVRVRFTTGSQQVFGVDFGLAWVRRRQRSLTRVVFASFCAAWLQAAVVPCVMAHAGDPVPRVEAPAGHDHAAHPGHEHAPMSGSHAAGHESHPCLYCPPDDAGAGSCDGHGGCAYPHEPQVDARAAGVIFAAVPVSFVAPSPGALLVEHRADPSVPDVVPRVSFAVCYCRFIE